MKRWLANPLKGGAMVALITLILDQLNKYYFIYGLKLAEAPIDVLPFFKLVMVWNQGVSFGMFASDEGSRRWMLIVLSLAIVVFLIRWLRQAHNLRLIYALGLVIGGAIGNVLDRLVFGAVADFFYFHYGEWYWPAFNIADSAIFIGVVILCWDSIVDKPSDKDEQA